MTLTCQQCASTMKRVLTSVNIWKRNNTYKRKCPNVSVRPDLAANIEAASILQNTLPWLIGSSTVGESIKDAASHLQLTACLIDFDIITSARAEQCLVQCAEAWRALKEVKGPHTLVGKGPGTCVWNTVCEERQMYVLTCAHVCISIQGNHRACLQGRTWTWEFEQQTQLAKGGGRALPSPAIPCVLALGLPREQVLGHLGLNDAVGLTHLRARKRPNGHTPNGALPIAHDLAWACTFCAGKPCGQAPAACAGMCAHMRMPFLLDPASV